MIIETQTEVRGSIDFRLGFDSVTLILNDETAIKLTRKELSELVDAGGDALAALWEREKKMATGATVA